MSDTDWKVDAVKSSLVQEFPYSPCKPAWTFKQCDFLIQPSMQHIRRRMTGTGNRIVTMLGPWMPLSTHNASVIPFFSWGLLPADKWTSTQHISYSARKFQDFVPKPQAATFLSSAYQRLLSVKYFNYHSWLYK